MHRVSVIGKVINSYYKYSLIFQIQDLESEKKIGFCFVGEIANEYRDLIQKGKIIKMSYDENDLQTYTGNWHSYDLHYYVDENYKCQIQQHRLSENSVQLRLSNNRSSFCIIDVETTGLDKNLDGDHIVQLCYQIFKINDKMKLRQLLFSKNYYLDTDKAISQEAFEITKLDRQTLKSKQTKKLKEVLEEMINHLKLYECQYLIAHNLKFDFKMLQNCFQRKKCDFSYIEQMDQFCTYENFGGKLGVLYENVCGSQGLDRQRQHDASYDVELLKQIFQELLNKGQIKVVEQQEQEEEDKLGKMPHKKIKLNQ